MRGSQTALVERAFILAHNLWADKSDLYCV
jgi:hypothetical protein